MLPDPPFGAGLGLNEDGMTYVVKIIFGKRKTSMMNITDTEQAASDIGWFFTNGEEIGFVASAGGKLPKSISKSKENIDILASYFRSLPQISDRIVNHDLNKIIPTRKVDDRYLFDFIDMAKKGLYAFDKTVLNNFSDMDYHLVAKPETPLKVDELPFEIMEILLETKIEGHIEVNFPTFD